MAILSPFASCSASEKLTSKDHGKMKLDKGKSHHEF